VASRKEKKMAVKVKIMRCFTWMTWDEKNISIPENEYDLLDDDDVNIKERRIMSWASKNTDVLDDMGIVNTSIISIERDELPLSYDFTTVDSSPSFVNVEEWQDGERTAVVAVIYANGAMTLQRAEQVASRMVRELNNEVDA